MKINIDKSIKTPLYKQIAEQIQAQITSGELPVGYKFPSERQLAAALNVNRTTVLNAYKELKADGLIVSCVGKGTIVSEEVNDPSSSPSFPEEPIWEHFISDSLKEQDSFDVNQYLELANRKNTISFAAGIASYETLPTQIFEEIEKSVLSQKQQKDLLVSPVAGFSSFRRAVSSYMQKRYCYCKPSEIMILSGSQQGIDLAARTFLNPGDIVFMEEPTFFPAILSFRSMGAKIMPIPMEPDGMNLDILEQLLLRYQPKLLYTIPSYHNPSGITMSLAKRLRLLKLIDKYKIPTLEDDAYGNLYYEEPPAAPLKSMDKSGCVLYLGTFSKTIYSGLRLGYVCAGKDLIFHFSKIRQLVDIHPNCISQMIVERFITSGEMDRYLELLRKEYGERQKLMADTLKRHAPQGMSWTLPAGGYYLWCKLPEGVTADSLASRAAERGVAILPGMPFFLTKQKGEGYIRLNYTFPPKPQIATGIKILCDVIKQMMLMHRANSIENDDGIMPIL